ncbi:NACHT domain-containing protein [Emcibacter sp. SYSU 3D8]|uniref:NACHT domain-containing protein n=1 Tax=Emcibacter sp. SYSU 3D8 TaxID=3133969 RepID=UPI0031FEE62F
MVAEVFIAQIVGRNLGRLIDLGKGIIKGTSEQIRFRLKSAYEAYLLNSSEKIGKSKSFTNRDIAVDIYQFYVDLDVRCGGSVIKSCSASDIVSISRRVVICATGGAGKSIFVKHLFMTALAADGKVPVLIELRRINETKETLIDAIVASLINNGFDLPREYILKGLDEGHFIVFLDGYDELSHEMKPHIAFELHDFSARNRKCNIIVTSRPDDGFSGWSDYHVAHLQALSQDAAIELIRKLGADKEITERFIGALKSGVFNSHASFLSIPLLLIIMFLTYGDNAEIPKKLSLFYSKAYVALFQQHDAFKGSFMRDRRTNLDIQDFSKIFSAFSLLTYDKRSLTFDRMEAISDVEKCTKLTGITVRADDFISDALQAVCLLMEDGSHLIFSHRSFQEYFVALFVANALPHVQEKIVERLWSNAWGDGVIPLLYEINQDITEAKILIPWLRAFVSNNNIVDSVERGDFINFLRRNVITISGTTKGTSRISSRTNRDMALVIILHNIGVAQFSRWGSQSLDVEEENRYLHKLFNREDDKPVSYSFDAPNLPEELYDYLDWRREIPTLSVSMLQELRAYLAALEEKHAKMERTLDDLLS